MPNSKSSKSSYTTAFSSNNTSTRPAVKDDLTLDSLLPPATRNIYADARTLRLWATRQVAKCPDTADSVQRRVAEEIIRCFELGESPLTNLPKLWKDIFIQLFGDERGVLPGITTSATEPYEVGNCFRIATEGFNKRKVFLRDFDHRSQYGILPVQMPGQEEGTHKSNPKSKMEVATVEKLAPVICYSRGIIAKGNRATWPDLYCNLCDSLIAELLRSDFKTRDLERQWPQTFKKGGHPRKERPNIGFPAFPLKTEKTVKDKNCYAVAMQGYLLCGDYRATERFLVAQDESPRKIGDYSGASARKHYACTEAVFNLQSVEQFLQREDLPFHFRLEGTISENTRRKAFGQPELPLPLQDAATHLDLAAQSAPASQRSRSRPKLTSPTLPPSSPVGRRAAFSKSADEFESNVDKGKGKKIRGNDDLSPSPTEQSPSPPRSSPTASHITQKEETYSDILPPGGRSGKRKHHHRSDLDDTDDDLLPIEPLPKIRKIRNMPQE
ncbi:MAG: hypothetical protein Q9208_004858 [Pyrenodesmia sp. 3 TL-2023]